MEYKNYLDALIAEIIPISAGLVGSPILSVKLNRQQTISVKFSKPQRPPESEFLLPSITSCNLDGQSCIFLHSPVLPSSSLQ